MNLKKVITGISLVVALALPLVLPLGASAQNRNMHRRNHQDSVHFHIVTSRNFFNEHPNFRNFCNRRSCPDIIGARTIVIFDIDDPSDEFTVNNSFLGEHSHNADILRVGVHHDTFTRVSNNFHQNNNLDIRVNTGNNTASFNTGSGIIRTGDIRVTVG